MGTQKRVLTLSHTENVIKYLDQIAETCKAIQDCYERDLSSLDDETVEHLIDLGDFAEEIQALIAEHTVLVARIKASEHTYLLG